MKVGSLFDGSGGFPLAASVCGIRPVWASEVETYPIAVTRSRFPEMVHLGDVQAIHGGEIEFVDVITFGSPCQDMSVAGRRKGLKHEENGDEETTRSGLFMEAIRITKEMRDATDGVYPRFAVWENVPGAFSSNKGEDFRLVLQEIVKIIEPQAIMPPVPKNGWAYADSYRGDGWSLAYRVFDAQYWGVPQRRRRIYIVADFGGTSAEKILFEQEGLRRNLKKSGEAKKDVARGIKKSVGGTNYLDGRLILDDQGGQQLNVRTDGIAPKLRAETHGNLPCVIDAVGLDGYNSTTTGDVSSTLGVNCGMSTGRNGVIIGLENYPMDSRVKLSDTLNTVDRHAICVPEVIPINDKATRFQNGGSSRNGDRCGNGLGVGKYGDPSPTLTAADRHAVCCAESETIPHYIVRRLTPAECARLQGFPDGWGIPEYKENFTEDEYNFWLDVRNTCAKINGKAEREYSKESMLKWYNKLHTDSAEYKMCGNGIALPCALYVMEGIAEAVENAQKD